MNEKELSEIRRRFSPGKHNIAHIYGCYVNERRDILSTFQQSLGMMPESEAEMYLSLLKRSLSGGLGKNLIDITFATSQVADSEEHRLLMALRSSALKDEEALQIFYKKIIEALHLEDQYVILLAHDRYDVPYRGRDAQDLDDSSTDVFSYFVCAICPVKQAKPALSYDIPEQVFHNLAGKRVICAPEFGFLFPAFDDRSTNIYNALYYSRNTTEIQASLVEALFHTPIPMPAAAQKESFQTLLSDTLADDCRLDVVQSVHEHLVTLIETHKVNKEIEPLTVSKQEVKGVLEYCGVSEAHLHDFESRYDETFGKDLAVPPRNIIDAKKFEVRTPGVVIQIDPERSDLIETRTIDGCRYLLIPADDGVEVNGVPIQLEDRKKHMPNEPEEESPF